MYNFKCSLHQFVKTIHAAPLLVIDILRLYNICMTQRSNLISIVVKKSYHYIDKLDI